MLKTTPASLVRDWQTSERGLGLTQNLFLTLISKEITIAHSCRSELLVQALPYADWLTDKRLTWHFQPLI